MKKTALVLAPILAIVSGLVVSLVVGVEFVSSVEANPFWGLTQYPGDYPAEPSQEFPTIKMDSPRNGEVLAATTAKISFTVTKPNSWNNYWYYLAPWINRPMPVVGSYIVYVYLDGKPSIHIMQDPGPVGFPKADYSLSYDKLARGIHNVSVVIVAKTLYDDPETDGFLTYPKNITETRQFTINADLPVPTPSPTPTPTPTPTTESFPTTLVTAPVSVIAVVACVALIVYFKRRFGKENP